MHFKINIIYCFLFLGFGASAQQPIVFNGQPKTEQTVNIIKQSLFYDDTSGHITSLEKIKKRKFTPVPPAYLGFMVSKKPLIVNWLNFKISNTHLTDTLKLILNCNVHNQTIVYENDKLLGQNATNQQGKNYLDLDRFGIAISIPPGQTNTYWVQILEQVNYLMPIGATLYTPKVYMEELIKDHARSQYLFVLMSMILGALLFMSMYAAYQYWLQKDLAFLYYAIYSIASGMMCFLMLYYRFGFAPFGFQTAQQFNIPISSLIPFFYALFVVHILSIRSNNSRNWLIVKLLLLAIMIETAIEIYENYTHTFIFTSNTYYLHIQALPMIFTNLFLLYLIIKSKSPLKIYLLTGVLLLLILVFLPNIIPYWIPNLSPKVEAILNFKPFFGLCGLLAEAICFAFALAYRAKLVQIEKNILQTNYAQNLATELDKKVNELAVQNNLLEAQRIKQLEISFEKRIAETEMTALRAQMNPHFIFNCLNSIKLYTLENDSETASAYLTTFSRLIRLVLENSQSEKVSLEKEIETLRLYIELEVMRFKDKVNYQIQIDQNVDLPYIEVPPLLIQPYVENAIWHGLMHKEMGGSVNITLNQIDEHLLKVEITDDGIGREQATELKSKSIMKHKSFGLKMTTERLQVINQLYEMDAEVNILDLKDENGKAIGTKVILKIPI